MNTNKILKQIRYILITGLLFCYGQTAQAEYLNVTLWKPDAHLINLDTDYNATTDIFSVYSIFSFGYPASGATLDYGSGPGNSFYIDFSLTANIIGGNGGDATFVSGSFTFNELNCDGSFPPTCTTGDSIVSGDLFALGYENDTQQFIKFLFNSTGGYLQPDYLAAHDGLGGIILNTTGYDENNFDTSFSASGVSADIAPVPVPAAAWLFGSGLLSLVGFTRRKSFTH